MKKIIFFAVVLSIFSCKKGNLDSIITSTDVTVEKTVTQLLEPPLIHGRLVFSSESHFDDYLQYLGDIYNAQGEEGLNSWEVSKGFTSMRSNFYANTPDSIVESLEDLPINDLVLFSLLNTGGIIEVNPWIFKLNTESRLIYVLPSSYAGAANDLFNTPSSPDIVQLSFDDEVFEILSSSSDDSKNRESCRPCTRADGDSEGWEDYCDLTIGTRYTFRYKARHKYENFGITKTLFSELCHRKRRGGSLYNHFVNHDIYFRYRWLSKRCEWGELTKLWSNPNWDGIARDRTWYHYRGTSCLKAFELETSFEISNLCDDGRRLRIDLNPIANGSFN